MNLSKKVCGPQGEETDTYAKHNGLGAFSILLYSKAMGAAQKKNG
jgi:hypothetical protein